MKRRTVTLFVASAASLIAFIIFTLLTRIVDVSDIGPLGSSVGFSSLNGFFHGLTGVNMLLYDITDILGLVPIGTALAFLILGIIEWIKRRDIRKVDYSLFVLGGFYITVVAVFLLFEILEINYRPILIEGVLEASYPSSTTMLCTTVMPTAIMQLSSRIKHKGLRISVSLAIAAFTAFMVVARVISGVHWFSDIVGGLLISTSLVLLYSAFISIKE